jgi:hypothetical protein
MINRSYECGEKLKFYCGLWRKTEAKEKDEKLKECKRREVRRRGGQTLEGSFVWQSM